MGERDRSYVEQLSEDAWIAVRWLIERGQVTEYAVILLAERGGERLPVRVYDNAHGDPELHRYKGADKQPAQKLPTRGSPNLDLPDAIAEVKSEYESMIDAWESSARNR